MKIKLIKIGGAVLENAEQRELFLDAFTAVKGPKVLVHGGGSTASAWAELKGISSSFIDGRRVTTPEMLEVATMVYSGLNKQLVAGLQQRGIQALGLCGADGKIVPAKKRSSEPLDFGMVGDPEMNARLSPLLWHLVASGYVPVIAPLSYDMENGTLLNTNADAVALFLAKVLQELGQVELIYAFGHAGVLKTLSDPDSLIAVLSETSVPSLKTDGTIHAGMLPKLECGFKALGAGAEKVRITKFDCLSAGTQLLLS